MSCMLYVRRSGKWNAPGYLLKTCVVLLDDCQGMETTRGFFHILLKKLDRTTRRKEGSCWKTPTPQLAFGPPGVSFCNRSSNFYIDLTSQSSQCWQAAFSCHFSQPMGLGWDEYLSHGGTKQRSFQDLKTADVQIKMRGHLVSPMVCCQPSVVPERQALGRGF